MSFGKLEAGLRRNCHGGQAGYAQIFIQRANRVVPITSRGPVTGNAATGSRWRGPQAEQAKRVGLLGNTKTSAAA